MSSLSTTRRTTPRRPRFSPLAALTALLLLLGTTDTLFAATATATATVTANDVMNADLVETTTPATIEGRWKIVGVYRDDEAIPVDGDGDDYFLTLKARPDSGTRFDVSVKIANTMRSGLELEEEAAADAATTLPVRVGLVMSTRMYPGSTEKQVLENFVSAELPKMTRIRVDVGGSSTTTPKLFLTNDEGVTGIDGIQA